MNQNIIVRVDFYPNKEIYPIAYVSKFGESKYIKRVSKIQIHSCISSQKRDYFCILTDNSRVVLSFSDGTWGVR